MIASWFSKAQAMTSSASPSAQTTASLMAHAPGWIARSIIQLQLSSSGKSSTLRLARAWALEASKRASKPRQAGHSGSSTSMTGTGLVCAPIGSSTSFGSLGSASCPQLPT